MSSSTSPAPAQPNDLHFIYNPFKPLSPAEKHVQDAGYPYVSTTVLERGGRLHEHRHHSRNTHLIISGSITIAKSRDADSRFRAIAKGPGSWVTLPSDVNYIGLAGEEGCTFVEGHTMLSPTTAERFLLRGDIVQVPAALRPFGLSDGC